MKNVSILPLVFVLCSVSAGFSQTYNVTENFSSTNPNGVWSYGYTLTSNPESNFTLYSDYVSTSDFLTWRAAPNVDSNFGKNISSGTLFGVPSGSVALHPGFDNQNAVLRFTAPLSGIYQLSIGFSAGNTGDTDALVLLNGDTATPLFYAITTDVNPAYEDTLSLETGDLIDIVVGSKGSYFFDSTPITAVISVPEPSTYALFLFSGAASLWGLSRRKS